MLNVQIFKVFFFCFLLEMNAAFIYLFSYFKPCIVLHKKKVKTKNNQSQLTHHRLWSTTEWSQKI